MEQTDQHITRQEEELAIRRELQLVVEQRQRELGAALKELRDIRNQCAKAKPEPGGMLKSFFGKRPNTAEYDMLCIELGQAEQQYKLAEAAYNQAKAARPKVTGEINIVALANEITLEMLWMPSGDFMMGSPDDEEGRSSNEGPQHHVTLTHGFWLGKHVVTQAQWDAVMDRQPGNSNGQLPVEQVSWNDCQEFIQRLNSRGVGTYRMPTEAQWEYACRAGTSTAYYFGNDTTQLDGHAWHNGNSGNKTHPAGSKQPNSWGLYDMYGNVWEWCQDWSADYEADPATDPTGPASGQERVLRGGNWYSKADNCRSASRSSNTPGSRIIGGGFRVSWTQ